MISIIIATYNSAVTISTALESVCKQSLQNWECIIVDGLSSDNTLQIVADYEKKDSRFRHLSGKDSGVFDALNKGVKIAKGEWIYVLGSDDELTVDGLSILVAAMDDDSSVGYGDAIALYPDGKTRKIRTKPLSYIKYNMVTSHQAMIVRKSVMEEFGYFDLRFKLCADFDLFQKIYLNGRNFKYVKASIAYYGMSGLSNAFSIKNDLDKYKVCKKNHSNSFPLLFFLLDEIKWMLTKLRDILL